ncbi:MAG: tetratricopeptide repeat protein [Bacteroidales bacterium]|nr:tetratricopeptide repeat protein [Bacteroidales bacterium]
MNRIKYFATLTTWWFLAWASDPVKLVDSGIAAYAGKKYDVAIEKFIHVLQMGYGSSQLYYNLGNAYYRMKDYPRALWCYEKALLWDASFSDARYNYDMVQKQLFSDKTSKPPYLTTVILKKSYELLPLKAWAIISVVFFVLVSIFFLIFFFSQSKGLRRLFFLISFLLFFFWVVSLVMTGYGYRQIYRNSYGFVVDNTLVLKSEPIEDAIAIGNVKPGLKVRILKEKDNFYYIETPDGMKGWIKKGNLLLLRSIVPIPQ